MKVIFVACFFNKKVMDGFGASGWEDPHELTLFIVISSINVAPVRPSTTKKIFFL